MSLENKLISAAFNPKDPFKMSEFKPNVSQEWVTRKEFEDMEHILIEREARLRDLLAQAVEQADGWYDECHGGPCPNLDEARAALEVKP